MNIFGLGPGELILVLTLALIVFGPKKLPEIGAGLGKAVGQFRKATNDLTQEITKEMQTDGLKELASLKDMPRDLRGVATTMFEAATQPAPAAETPQPPAPPVAQPAQPPQVADAAVDVPVVAPASAPAPALEPAAAVDAQPAPVAPPAQAEQESRPNGATPRLRIREADAHPPQVQEPEA
jgi:TatA/E family protein of Tat protein translocase